MKNSKRQAGEASWLGIILGLASIAMMGLVSLAFNSCQCSVKARAMEFKSSYGPIQGCIVETKDGAKVQLEKYRYMGD